MEVEMRIRYSLCGKKLGGMGWEPGCLCVTKSNQMEFFGPGILVKQGHCMAGVHDHFPLHRKESVLTCQLQQPTGGNCALRPPGLHSSVTPQRNLHPGREELIRGYDDSWEVDCQCRVSYSPLTKLGILRSKIAVCVRVNGVLEHLNKEVQVRRAWRQGCDMGQHRRDHRSVVGWPALQSL